jgi:hypothetical protein
VPVKKKKTTIIYFTLHLLFYKFIRNSFGNPQSVATSLNSSLNLLTVTSI